MILRRLVFLLWDWQHRTNNFSQSFKASFVRFLSLELRYMSVNYTVLYKTLYATALNRLLPYVK